MGPWTFSAPLPTPEPPAVDAFLSAVDRTTNGNTLLLTAECDPPLTAQDGRAALPALLRSDLFDPLLRGADARRGWHNLTDGSRPHELPLLRRDFRAALAPLDRAGFLARLRRMLREAWSPYRHRLPAAQAERLVGDFARELLGPDGRDDPDGRDAPAWSFAAVGPDFLRCAHYPDDAPEPWPTYFDGCGNDTATLAHRGRTLHLLLTNGSP
ncbi:hypothetical protein Kpho02_41810 [Kitasatospora phosalacinea]|uniref:Uncharacterized protein n=1 Tax=Kitasatospora phosalacinea TaxID=2065 RepID=A0A9W6V448_9ACTN|nr:hypothetical protein [Kitasatospora phosalacinea]GLW71882.1 hypothetical protein Kpho02_41810 [Kitasatospora phosalacinea]